MSQIAEHKTLEWLNQLGVPVKQGDKCIFCSEILNDLSSFVLHYTNHRISQVELQSQLEYKEHVDNGEIEILSDDDSPCCICGDEFCTAMNPIIFCDGPCQQAFHKECLNLSKVPGGDWYCSISCAYGDLDKKVYHKYRKKRRKLKRKDQISEDIEQLKLSRRASKVLLEENINNTSNHKNNKSIHTGIVIDSKEGKLWFQTELAPYFNTITSEHLSFLRKRNTYINEYSIPLLGEHYKQVWYNKRRNEPDEEFIISPKKRKLKKMNQICICDQNDDDDIKILPTKHIPIFQLRSLKYSKDIYSNLLSNHSMDSMIYDKYLSTNTSSNTLSDTNVSFSKRLSIKAYIDINKQDKANQLEENQLINNNDQNHYQQQQKEVNIELEKDKIEAVTAQKIYNHKHLPVYGPAMCYDIYNNTFSITSTKEKEEVEEEVEEEEQQQQQSSKDINLNIISIHNHPEQVLYDDQLNNTDEIYNELWMLRQSLRKQVVYNSYYSKYLLHKIQSSSTKEVDKDYKMEILMKYQQLRDNLLQEKIKKNQLKLQHIELNNQIAKEVKLVMNNLITQVVENDKIRRKYELNEQRRLKFLLRQFYKNKKK